MFDITKAFLCMMEVLYLCMFLDITVVHKSKLFYVVLALNCQLQHELFGLQQEQ